MLETPLFGRFGKENRRLVFGPTLAYDILVNATVIGGGALALLGYVGNIGPISAPLDESWSLGTGAAVCLAGVWAYLSLVRISFDLKNGTYWRRQGPGFFPRLTMGTLKDLDALVLIAEPNGRLAGGVTYHLVLHWKGNSQPLMVVQNDTRVVFPGQPLQAGGAHLLALGMKYAQALGIPLYDNSHFASRCPVSIFS